MAKKKQPQSHPKGFWNWDVDDAAPAKQQADLTPDERAAAQKALAKKKRLREKPQSEVVA